MRRSRLICQRPSIVAAALLSVGLLPAQIKIETFPDYRLHITNGRYDATWQIRLPEVVASNEGVFLTSTRPSLEWTASGNSYSYRWTSTADYAKAVRQAMGDRQHLAVGIEVNTKVQVFENRLALEVALHNPTDRPMTDVWIDGGCLTHLTERFFDDDHSRTYIFTSKGLTRLSELDRSIAIRSKYFVNPAWFDEPSSKSYEFFWGRSSTVPAGSLIVSQPARGLGAIGIAWENCSGLRQNSDSSHHCMHSSSYFGDLMPGATITRHGTLFFGDSIDEVVGAYSKQKFGLYKKPPRPR